MAYTPGAPWDESLAYTKGQTCTYNGLPYVYWHPTEPSSAGTNPTEDMKMFTAKQGELTDSRSDRSWVLADYVLNAGADVSAVCYGDVRNLQTTIRNINGFPAQDMVYDYYSESTLDYYIFSQYKTEQNWLYYTYDNLFLYNNIGGSYDLGLANPPHKPFPITDTNYNLYEQPAPTIGLPPSSVTPNPAYIYVIYRLPTFAMIPPIVNYPENTPDFQRSNIFTRLMGFSNIFNRNASFKATWTYHSNTAPYPVTRVIVWADTINSGPHRDNWTTDADYPYKSYVYPLPVDGEYPTPEFKFEITGFTPPFAN